MATTNEKSQWDDLPDDPSFTFHPGWYAVVVCWDIQEGMFPRAAYHDGKKWIDDPRVVLYNPALFISKEAAQKWAEDHDPEF